jgi:hypothetical protein
MVAGVLRFCWQDDTLGGRTARRRIRFGGTGGELPLTCSLAPQLTGFADGARRSPEEVLQQPLTAV